jgi:hypothetical protein
MPAGFVSEVIGSAVVVVSTVPQGLSSAAHKVTGRARCLEVERLGGRGGCGARLKNCLSQPPAAPSFCYSSLNFIAPDC